MLLYIPHLHHFIPGGALRGVARVWRPAGLKSRAKKIKGSRQQAPASDAETPDGPLCPPPDYTIAGAPLSTGSTKFFACFFAVRLDKSWCVGI